MSEPAIEIRGVVKSYGSKPVLTGLDLAVPKGSVVGLLGTNGAGKTTLIKCALGLIRPQAGEVRVLGEPAWTLSAAAKARIGYVPQVIGLYPWMKVRHLIDYTAAF
jgi:ABC-2 type transport system ATP-binding protein